MKQIKKTLNQKKMMRMLICSKSFIANKLKRKYFILVKEDVLEKSKNDSHFKLLSFFLLFGIFVFLNFNLVAQDTLSKQKKLVAQDTLSKQKIKHYKFKNSISLSAIIILGSLQINYERLVGDRHGLVAEGYYAFTGSSKGTPTIGLAYRYHFNKSLHGAFASAFYRWGNVHYEADFEENGIKKKLSNAYNYKFSGFGFWISKTMVKWPGRSDSSRIWLSNWC